MVTFIPKLASNFYFVFFDQVDQSLHLKGSTFPAFLLKVEINVQIKLVVNWYISGV